MPIETRPIDTALYHRLAVGVCHWLCQCRVHLRVITAAAVIFALFVMGGNTRADDAWQTGAPSVAQHDVVPVAEPTTGPSPTVPSSTTPSNAAPSNTATSKSLPESVLPESLLAGPKAWTSPEGVSSSLQVMLLLAVVSLAPAALLMTTCYVRIVVVLSFLRQALGSQGLPPTQVITTLSLFLTLMIMSPVWRQVYDDAIVPYTNHQIDGRQAWKAGEAPIRRFMSMQIENAKNTEDVWLFMKYVPHSDPPASYDDVPLTALLPAFMLSELKTSFLIGFQIFLPFLILDLVVASVMTSMGMLMMPPSMVSLPFKLLLFVLVDGWHLIVGMLLQSFQAFT